MSEQDLIDAPATERDYQADALARLARTRPALRAMTLDQALADPFQGRIVRAFGLQLQHVAEAEARRRARGFARKVRR